MNRLLQMEQDDAERPARTLQRKSVAPEAEPKAHSRIDSIDLVRGIVIILMALDHVHDFFGDLAAQPTNLSTTTASLFFMRWITHFCAPVFFLLTGTGAFLMLRRKSQSELSRFLFSRGVWLIFLELVVMRFALQFNFNYQITIITVLWALGWSMIVLAGLIWLPTWSIAGIGIAMIASHNTFDGIQVSELGVLAPLWDVVHSPGMIFDNGRHAVYVAYVLIPWIGVTASGYVLGQVFRMNGDHRRALLLGLGIFFCTGFILLRLLNAYGDPVPWSPQKSPLWTLMSFVNTNKYPPSLLFLLMTLGPSLILLRAVDNGVPTLLRPALTIGRVPLFFYVLHFFLIHLLAVAASWLRYGKVNEMFQSPDIGHFPFSQPLGWGASVLMMCLLWIAVVAMMFPLCRWYAEVKRQRNDWWLGYL